MSGIKAYYRKQSVIVFLFGPPGAGKTTLGKYLVQKLKGFGFSVSFASMSDLLEKDWPEEAERCYKYGKLLDNTFPIVSADKFINSVEPGGFIICDGFLRTPIQAREIIRKSKMSGTPIFINMNLPNGGICLYRMRRRAMKEDRVDSDPSVCHNRLKVFLNSNEEIQEIAEDSEITTITLDASVDGIENVYNQIIDVEEENVLSACIKIKMQPAS